ncbi:hypothetical protein, partial [Enterobacter hormaechei]|uniref:hypothetical protein n=1 Tax=Enterobacter hormaechei TaxID=158836 RepID=UPI00200D8968
MSSSSCCRRSPTFCMAAASASPVSVSQARGSWPGVCSRQMGGRSKRAGLVSSLPATVVPSRSWRSSAEQPAPTPSLHARWAWPGEAVGS